MKLHVFTDKWCDYGLSSLRIWCIENSAFRHQECFALKMQYTLTMILWHYLSRRHGQWHEHSLKRPSKHYFLNNFYEMPCWMLRISQRTLLCLTDAFPFDNKFREDKPIAGPFTGRTLLFNSIRMTYSLEQPIHFHHKRKPFTIQWYTKRDKSKSFLMHSSFASHHVLLENNLPLSSGSDHISAVPNIVLSHHLLLIINLIMSYRKLGRRSYVYRCSHQIRRWWYICNGTERHW